MDGIPVRQASIVDKHGRKVRTPTINAIPEAAFLHVHPGGQGHDVPGHGQGRKGFVPARQNLFFRGGLFHRFKRPRPIAVGVLLLHLRGIRGFRPHLGRHDFRKGYRPGQNGRQVEADFPRLVDRFFRFPFACGHGPVPQVIRPRHFAFDAPITAKLPALHFLRVGGLFRQGQAVFRHHLGPAAGRTFDLIVTDFVAFFGNGPDNGAVRAADGL